MDALVVPTLFAAAASVVVGVLLSAAVALIVRFGALPAASRYTLWFVVVITTAAVPFVSIGASIVRAEIAPTLAGTPATADAEPSRTVAIRRSVRTEKRAAVPQASAVAHVAPIAKLDPHIATALLAVWAIGSICGFAGLVASLIDVRTLRRRSRPLGGGLEDDLPWFTQSSAGRRETYLRLSDDIETPVAVGFVRPVVFVPAELAEAGGLAAIESLIMHEHAHLRRYDDWTNLIARIVERALWFNPAIWFAGRRLALEREIAADDVVVERTGRPHAYATTLWQLAREMRMPAHATVAPGAFFTRKQISIRIEALLDRTPHRRPRRAATIAAFATACLLLATIASQAPALEMAPIARVAPIAAQPPTAPAPTHVVRRSRGTREGDPEPPHRSSRVLLAERALPVAAPVVAAAPSRIAASDVVPQPPIAPTAPPTPTVARDDRIVARGTRAVREMLSRCLGCDLHGQSLRGADLHGLSIVGADLSGADLRDANLDDATLTAVNLRDATLTGASLVRARFTGTQLDGVSLQGVDTAGLRMTGVSLAASDLHGLDVRALVTSCVGCNFAGADLRGADLHGLHLVGVNLANADLSGANLRSARLDAVNLANALLSGVDLRNASILASNLEGVRLRGARLSGLELRGINVRTLDLSGADVGNR